MLRRLLLLAMLFGAAVAVEKVVTITGEESFKQVMKDFPSVVVEFYAPWCGHCKKLAPEFEKAAGMLRTMGENIVLAKCDATDDKNKDLAKKFGVKGYPTLKVFKGHDHETALDYNGPREAGGIVDYVLNLFGPPSGRLDTKRDVEKFLTASTKAIGVFSDENSSDFKAFEAAADLLREEVKCGHSFDASNVELCEGGKCEKSKIFVKVEEDEEGIKEYEGEMRTEDIRKWAVKAVAPKLVELGSSPRHTKALKTIFGSDLPRLFGFVDADSKNLKEIRAALIEANNDENLNVIFVDPKTNPKALSYFSIEKDAVPSVVLHRQSDGKKFISSITGGKDVKKFLEQYEAGEIDPFIKSEEIPENNDGAVKVVVGKSFDDVVVGSGKNVMIEFYAPWCGHCKKLEPIYEEVGEHFKDDPTVIIAKMDNTANDIPDSRFQVKGFPTLKFFTAQGEVKDYPGKRTKEALIEFIDKEKIIMEVDVDYKPPGEDDEDHDAESASGYLDEDEDEEYGEGDEVYMEEDEEDEYLDEDDEPAAKDEKDEL
ncbi:hypothetical protein BSKO_10476 [Bryopsis sp. KO-2023]|nr:hypothetical protein BSKO_10476 [Bryopsis sp. KO-2023]